MDAFYEAGLGFRLLPNVILPPRPRSLDLKSPQPRGGILPVLLLASVSATKDIQGNFAGASSLPPCGLTVSGLPHLCSGCLCLDPEPSSGRRGGEEDPSYPRDHGLEGLF